MAVTIQLPSDLEQALRRQFTDLDSAAKEALLVELYRQDKIAQYELAQALGLHRLEVDALLKKYNVIEDLPSAHELAEDLRRLVELVGKRSSFRTRHRSIISSSSTRSNCFPGYLTRSSFRLR